MPVHGITDGFDRVLMGIPVHRIMGASIRMLIDGYHPVPNLTGDARTEVRYGCKKIMTRGEQQRAARVERTMMARAGPGAMCRYGMVVTVESPPTLSLLG